MQNAKGVISSNFLYLHETDTFTRKLYRAWCCVIFYFAA